jgi:hypothetical protein
VSLCDSNRDEVQQFGRDLVVRNFTAERGPRFLLELSEHPAPSMQAFVSAMVAEHAAGDTARLAKLLPFFSSVLGRVNRGRVAKERALDFLGREALGSREAAGLVAELLSVVSATMAKTYKARAIEILAAIRTAHPDVPMPLSKRVVEQRHAL